MRYKLERLPFWGENVRLDAINFEYPSQEVFEDMDSFFHDPSVSLKALKFTEHGLHLASVQCVYSDSSEDPHSIKL